MTRRQIATGALILAVATAAGASAYAQAKPEDIVKARIARFREMGASMKSVTDELKKDSPIRMLMSSSAQGISPAMRGQATLFPVGTGPAPKFETRALATVWTDRKEFDALAAKLIVEADKLAVLTRGTDDNAIREQLKAVGQACSACHKKFRAEKD